MSIRQYINDQGDKLKLIGGIIMTLNRIENIVVTSISVALINLDDADQEKNTMRVPKNNPH